MRTDICVCINLKALFCITSERESYTDDEDNKKTFGDQDPRKWVRPLCTACLNKLKYGLKRPYIYQGQILPLICTKPSSPTNSSREMMFSKPILKREKGRQY